MITNRPNESERHEWQRTERMARNSPLPPVGGDEGEGGLKVFILSTPTLALPHQRGRGDPCNYGLINSKGFIQQIRYHWCHSS